MHDPHENTTPERLRRAPRERLSGPSQVLDLHQALRDLRAAAPAVHGGHRQSTLVHHAPLSQLLFAFETDGALDNHAAPGVVTLHVLEGRLLVQADGQEYTLRAGQVLVLSPDVLHNVRALEASGLLLTVCLTRQPQGL
ncbi:MAG: cupin domain-containing protein [Candidatus Tectimicrobiota bacterium]